MLHLQQAVGNHATTRLLRAPDIARIDIARIDTARPDTVRPDVLRPDALRPDTARGLAPATGLVGAPELPQGPTSGDRDLQSPRFAGDPVLENCLDGKQTLKIGSSGAAVAKVQQGLIDAGFPLPQFGPDGRFGGETHTAVKAFQTESGLTGKNVDGIVGRTTMGLLDARFLAAPPQPGTCVDGAINTDQDALPGVPPFAPEFMPAPQVLAEVKKMQPPGVPVPATPPLGAFQPTFTKKPVSVTAIPVPGSTCVKCAADWDISAQVRVLIATGSFSDEPKRFAVFQPGSVSGCPPQALPQLLDVNKIILPEAVPFIVAGELEHYLDFVRAFRIAAGRYLANVRRLTRERTHLLASSPAECADKVERFLMLQGGHPPLFLGVFLLLYTDAVVEDFEDLFFSPNRDGSHAHDAFSRPPMSQKPTFPDIDLDKNPFGCKAFARKFDRRSFPGIPGPASEKAVVDQNQPPKRAWHVL